MDHHPDIDLRWRTLHLTPGHPLGRRRHRARPGARPPDRRACSPQAGSQREQVDAVAVRVGDRRVPLTPGRVVGRGDDGVPGVRDPRGHRVDARPATRTAPRNRPCCPGAGLAVQLGQERGLVDHQPDVAVGLDVLGPGLERRETEAEQLVERDGAGRSVALTATAAICMAPEYTHPPTEARDLRGTSGLTGRTSRRRRRSASASGSSVSPVCTGPGWITVLRGAVSQRNREPSASRPAAPAPGSAAQMSAAACSARPIAVGVGGRVQRAQPVDVEVHPGAEVVALPAVDEDAGVQRLPPLDPGDDAQHGVLEGVPRHRWVTPSGGGGPSQAGRFSPRGARRRPPPPASAAATTPGQPRVAGGQPGEQLVDVPRAQRGGVVVLEPLVGHLRQHRPPAPAGSPGGASVGVGGGHLRLALEERVRRRVVGPGHRGGRAGPVVVERQRGAVVDQLQPAVPEQHVRVAPGPVDVADQRVEPQHPAGQPGSTPSAPASKSSAPGR